MKIKKILSLVLALTMVLTLAAPAFAVTAEEDVHVHESICEGEDGIEPYARIWCANCDAVDGYQEYKWDTVDWNDRTVACTRGAQGCSGDYTVRKYQGLRCSKCLYVYYSSHIDTGKFCPGFGGYYYYFSSKQ